MFRYASQFNGGSLIITRLTPREYHRFHSPVNGIWKQNEKKMGKTLLAYRHGLRVKTKTRTKVFSSPPQVTLLRDIGHGGGGLKKFSLSRNFCHFGVEAYVSKLFM